jgi:hypothetical protein
MKRSWIVERRVEMAAQNLGGITLGDLPAMHEFKKMRNRIAHCIQWKPRRSYSVEAMARLTLANNTEPRRNLIPSMRKAIELLYT